MMKAPSRGLFSSGGRNGDPGDAMVLIALDGRSAGRQLPNLGESSRTPSPSLHGLGGIVVFLPQGFVIVYSPCAGPKAGLS